MKNAFHEWLKRESEGDTEICAALLFQIFMSSNTENEQIWDLLQKTGDANYSQETFRKAARMVLNDDKKETLS